jgi:hypothetical protein
MEGLSRYAPTRPAKLLLLLAFSPPLLAEPRPP